MSGTECGGRIMGLLVEERGWAQSKENFLEKVNPLVDRIVGETPFKELFP